MKAILTGSRVYGKPREDSDLDIVILCTKQEQRLFESVCDEKLGEASKYPSNDSTHIYRFGNLNLITVSNEAEFFAWTEGTEFLKELQTFTNEPVSKETAIKILEGHGVQQGNKKVIVGAELEYNF